MNGGHRFIRHPAVATAIAAALVLPTLASGAAGDLDPSFGDGGTVVTLGNVPAANAAALQPEGNGLGFVSHARATTGTDGRPSVVVGPVAAAAFDGGRPFHGAGGDELLLFAVQPDDAPAAARGIPVASRLTGRQIGSVTPPPAGWGVPLSIELFNVTRQGPATHGSFLVLDTSVNPEFAGTAPAMIHRYSYTYSPAGGLTTTWAATHVLPLAGPPGPDLPTGLVYAEGFARLPGGSVAVTDTIGGAIWIAPPSLDDWRLAMIDPRFAPGFGEGDISGISRAPGGGTRTYTLRLPSIFPGGPPVYPGIHSITYAAVTDEVVTLRTAPPGGIYALPLSVLLDPTIPPFAKGDSLREVVPPQIGLSDSTDGVVYDRFHPTTRWVYWQRAVSDEIGGGSNVLRRVDLTTGRVEEVARSNTLYDWTSNLAVLPPIDDLPVSLVLSAMGQEENNPEINVLLSEPQYVGPSLLTLVAVSH